MTNDEMDRLTEGLDSKAAKVRALNAAGVSTGDISRYLDIRYQHVYNVLLRAGVIEKKAPAERSEVLRHPEASVFVGRVSEHGAIELPAGIMQQYGLAAGDTVFCRALPEGLFILSREAALREITEMAREKMPEQAALIEALFNPHSTGAIRKP